MYRRTKDNHTVNVAAIMVAAFGYARFHNPQALYNAIRSGRTRIPGKPQPAGSKLARMAAAQTLTKKGSERNG